MDAYTLGFFPMEALSRKGTAKAHAFSFGSRHE